MNVHGVAEAPDDPLGAQAAGFVLIRIATLRNQNLLVAHGHAAAAHPFVAIAGVNMVEVGQLGSPSSGADSSEYHALQIASARRRLR